MLNLGNMKGKANWNDIEQRRYKLLLLTIIDLPIPLQNMTPFLSTLLFLAALCGKSIA